MKYKILLTGNNQPIIDDFFTRLSNLFECQNSSPRYEDILSHIEYFKPAAFVYCINQQEPAQMRKTAAIKHNKTTQSTPLILIGSKSECAAFTETAGDVADLIIDSFSGTSDIRDQLLSFLQKPTPETKSEPLQSQPAPVAAPDENSELLSLLEETQRDLCDIAPTAEAASSGRKHILVVDDDSRMLKVINRHLAEHYDVATAINGRVALKFLQTKKTDLVLLDYEMPLENGPAVLEKIRSNPMTQDLPVVFLTGTSERRKIQQALALKPQGYLLKPIDHVKLLSTIKKLIG